MSWYSHRASEFHSLVDYVTCACNIGRKTFDTDDCYLTSPALCINVLNILLNWIIGVIILCHRFRRWKHWKPFFKFFKILTYKVDFFKSIRRNIFKLKFFDNFLSFEILNPHQQRIQNTVCIWNHSTTNARVRIIFCY